MKNELNSKLMSVKSCLRRTFLIKLKKNNLFIQGCKAAGNAIDNASKNNVGSVVEWLTHRTDDQHGLGSKPTCAILLCSWEKHFTALSPAWWS